MKRIFTDYQNRKFGLQNSVCEIKSNRFGILISNRCVVSMIDKNEAKNIFFLYWVGISCTSYQIVCKFFKFSKHRTFHRLVYFIFLIKKKKT